jgi:VWFA-related protein
MRLRALLVMLAVAAAGQQQPSVKILTPASGDYVTGPTVISVAVTAGSDTLTSLVVQANGARVCQLAKPPFRCEWDAGAVVRLHQIRAVATFASGARMVDNVRTSAVDATDEASVRSVLVGTTVKDGRGRAVPDLPREAFELRVNGKVTPVTFFGSEELPLDVLVALDISGSMAAHLPKVRLAVRAFTESLRSQDRLALAAFNTGLFVLAPLATPGDAHLKAAERLASFGGTAFHEAMSAGLSVLPAAAGRRVMIFFTDAEDRLSQASAEQAERALLSENVLFYVVGHGAAREQPRKDMLERLCERTGGKAVFIDDLSDLRRAFTELVQDLKTQYTLGFDPDADAKGWQPIEVRVRDRKMKVRAREGNAAGT